MTIRSAQGGAFPRSFLFVPANRGEMFARAFESQAEAIVFDLEDSVPAGQKKAARDAVAELKPPAGITKPFYVRLDAIGTSDFDEDVRAVAHAPIAGVILPKIERSADVQAADHVVPASLALILLIETPGGVLRLAEIVDSGVRRVAAFAFGAEDYRAGVGVDVLDPALGDAARTAISNAAAAARVPAIDAPELKVHDEYPLRMASRMARALGFRAKFAIHPSQVAVIHEELGEGEDRTWAARVVEAYGKATAEGKGSTLLDGRMIDEATMKRAREILRIDG